MITKHILFQVLIASLTLISTSGFSHDFWLEAHPFYTRPGQSVDISVHVGNQFVGDSLPNIVSWYSDFSLYQVNSKTEIDGELGRDPAGYFNPEKQGSYAIGYQSDFNFVEIEPDIFIKYLNEEGLDNAIAYRKKHNQTDTIAKEYFIRHAKTLVQAGKDFDVDNSMVNFGYELEIIPLNNPYNKSLNEYLSVKVLFKNKPVQNILLNAYSKTSPEQIQSIRTDKKGRASIKLDRSGPWLLKVVKILKIDDKKADWQSHWASLTFSIR